MTVRCDACGTENRDKAMFCRGCAGKLPAFTPTGKPALDGSEFQPVGATGIVGSKRRPSSFGASCQSLSTRTRFMLVSLLVVGLLGTGTWLFFAPASGNRQMAVTTSPAVSSRLPPEDSLASGESLAGNDAPVAMAPVPSPATPLPATPLPAIPEPDAAPSGEYAVDGAGLPPALRSSGRRPVPETRSTARALNPRVGCEHLFFAFAARCEANHCQQAAYARHPRCDAVREQRRLDDARRNSMPIS